MKLIDIYPNNKLIGYITDQLEDEFEKKLFEASLSFLNQVNNPLALNAFSFSLRELIRHVLDRLAPESNVKATIWFEQDQNAKAGQITRKQRFKYSVQKGLPDKFVIDDLKINIDKEWSEIRDSINMLSKYTHVNRESFDANKEQLSIESNKALFAVWSIFASISDLENMLVSSLHNAIEDEVQDAAIRETNAQIDILSNNSYIENAFVEDWEITSIDSKSIEFSGKGISYVVLEYGKGDDGLCVNEEFPFSFSGYCKVSEPRLPIIEAGNIRIETDCWYE